MPPIKLKNEWIGYFNIINLCCGTILLMGSESSHVYIKIQSYLWSTPLYSYLIIETTMDVCGKQKLVFTPINDKSRATPVPMDQVKNVLAVVNGLNPQVEHIN